jgi:hypothetical protein
MMGGHTFQRDFTAHAEAGGGERDLGQAQAA